MRKRRELIEGATYHIVARANRGEMILGSDFFKELFLDVIRRAKKKYCFQFYNFCLMGNHIHFILHPLKGAKLSSIMQWILSVFAQLYNRMLNLKGHVWYDRFKSKILNSLKNFLSTFIYVTYNPVKAGLVEDPVEYRYGGLYFWIHGKWEFFKP